MKSDENPEIESVDETDVIDTDAAHADTVEVDTDAGDIDGGGVAVSDDDPVTAQTPAEDSRHWLASLGLATAVAALVAAVVCLGYFGYTGIRAYTVEADRSQVRIEAVDGAEQAVLNFLTIETSQPKAWQERMKSSLTGDALKQAIEGFETVRAQLDAAKSTNMKISAKVVRSAATEVNADEDTATVLVMAESTSSDNPTQPQPQSNLLTMVKVDGVWKAEKIVPLSGIEYDPNTAQPVPNEGGK